MSASSDRLDRADAAAADWMARLRSGALDETERQDLACWLEADQLHRDRFAHYEGLWLALGGLRDEPRILAVREDVPQLPRRRHVGLIAAGLVLLLTVAGGAGLWSIRHPAEPQAPSTAIVSRLETDVGEVTRIALEDGSTLTLDTDSAVETSFDIERRNVRLLKGRAFFRVAHDKSRPFTVAMRRFGVTATGTQFVVAMDGPTDSVQMVEGSVIAAPTNGIAGPQIPLATGRSLKVARAGQWILGSAGAQDLAWITGVLTFRNARLDIIAQEMNRYSSRKIRFADPIVAGNRLNAVLKAGDVDTFLESVEQLSLGKVSKSEDGQIILSRR